MYISRVDIIQKQIHIACWHNELFVPGFSSHSRIFHSYGDVNITDEKLQIWPLLCTHGHWALRVYQRATPAVTRGIRLKWSSPMTGDTHTYCRAFSTTFSVANGIRTPHLEANTQYSACVTNALTDYANTAAHKLRFCIIFLNIYIKSIFPL